MDITIPGVQNPHWEPWDFAIRSYTREAHILSKQMNHL